MHFLISKLWYFNEIVGDFVDECKKMFQSIIASLTPKKQIGKIEKKLGMKVKNGR